MEGYQYNCFMQLVNASHRNQGSDSVPLDMGIFGEEEVIVLAGLLCPR